MANIATVVISSDAYVDLTEEIRKKIPSFSFTAGSTYILQARGAAKICEKSTQPVGDEGFRIKFTEPFTYIAGTEKLWVARGTVLTNVVINVAE